MYDEEACELVLDGLPADDREFLHDFARTS